LTSFSSSSPLVFPAGILYLLNIAQHGSTTHPPLLVDTGTQDRNTKVIPFNYYVAAPVLMNGWVFLGEKGKRANA